MTLQAQHLSYPEDLSMIWQDSFCLAPFHEWGKEDERFLTDQAGQLHSVHDKLF
jgi:hypothetical protein